MNSNENDINDGAAQPGKKNNSGYRKELSTLLFIALLAFSTALFLRLCVAQAYEIRGNSMNPTFTNGNRVMLLKLSPEWIPINREDLVIFVNPNNPMINLVKRVIGKGGDHIRMSGGKVYINGKLEDQTQWDGTSVPKTFPRGEKTQWTVPPHSYFVLGDNRTNSKDSRDLGPIPERLLKGKILFRWWPLFANISDN